MAGPVKAIKPEETMASSNLNCMGAGEEAPPRVHTSARPAPAPAPALAPLLRGRANTLNVLSLSSEVTSRPRMGKWPCHTHTHTHTVSSRRAAAPRRPGPCASAHRRKPAFNMETKSTGGAEHDIEPIRKHREREPGV